MGEQSKSKLYEELKIGELVLSNRVVLAPMTRARCGKERVPDERVAEYYAQRAGAGLIITEATVVSEQGIGWIDSPGIYNEAQVAGWKKVVEAVQAKGAPIFLQLWHCGRASHSAFHGGKLPVAPSAIKLNGDHVHTPEGKKEYEVPRALETEEVEAVVRDYSRAAKLAKEAGFDGVEVHAANGYLIDQFLQSKTNVREDEYGGSLENRFRFLNEILGVVSEFFDAARIGVRLAPNGVFNDMGSKDYREAFTYFVQRLDKWNLGYLHVMDGLAFGFHELGEPMTLKDVRAHYAGALMGNCGYTKETAELAVDEGNADFISFGRPYISNPDLAERFENGWPLAELAPMEHWYTPGEEGYVDYPPYRE